MTSNILVAVGLVLIALPVIRNIINPRMPHTGKRKSWFIKQHNVWKGAA